MKTFVGVTALRRRDLGTTPSFGDNLPLKLKNSLPMSLAVHAAAANRRNRAGGQIVTERRLGPSPEIAVPAWLGRNPISSDRNQNLVMPAQSLPRTRSGAGIQ
jgi:hypothetical protein